MQINTKFELLLNKYFNLFMCFNVFILGRHCHTLLEWLGFIGTWIIILILFFTPIYSLKNE